MGIIANGGVNITFEGTEVAVPDEIIKKIDHVRVLMEKEELILPSSAEEIDGWLEEAVRIVN